MQKNKKIYLLVLLIVISSIIFITGASFSTASTTQEFSDVNENDWFFSDVQYVHEKNLMNGTSETTFSPDDSTTRAMIATVLWRMEGCPEDGEVIFEDVERSAYYTEAVAWCAKKNIVYGYSNTAFGPDDFITREQLVTMIYRYADYKGYDVTDGLSLSKYSDADDISSFALVQFEWAIANGIITGTSDDILSPREIAKRAQVAAILKRFCTKFEDASAVEKGSQAEEKKTEKPSGGGYVKKPAGDKQDEKGTSENDEEKTDVKPAETFPVISCDSINAKPGEPIQLAINIKNNPGILGMILSVHFDEKALSLEKAENGEVLYGLEFTTSKNLESGVRLVWDGIEIKPEDVKNGTFLLLNFKVKDDAKAGKYPITIKYTEGDILDNDLKTVTPSVEDGYITVLEGGDTQ